MSFWNNLRTVIGIKAAQDLKSYIDSHAGGGLTPIWSDTIPTDPEENQIWYNTDQSPPQMNVWHNSAWVVPGAVDYSAETNASQAVTAAQTAANAMPIVLGRPPTDEGDPMVANVLWFDSADNFKAYVYDHALGHWHPVSVATVPSG